MSTESEAAKWLQRAACKWRLQTLSRRVRYVGSERKELPVRIRRFLNGTPVGLVNEVMALLESQAPYSGRVFNFEPGDGLSYVPTRTLIRKDGPEFSSGADATYTIIQDLRLADEDVDTLGLQDESSCSRMSETTWVWDAPTVDPAPDGSQGVSYQVVNVSRDAETDLFSYQLRKVTALTQHSLPKVVECDARRTVTEEIWDNVYGEDGAYLWDPVPDHGASAPVELPAPCSQEDGTTVQFEIRENADCTYRIIARTTVAKEDERGLGGTETVLERSSWTSDANAPAPLPDAPAASGGVIVKRESEKNPDGTWNVREDVTVELPSPAHEVVKSKSLRAVRLRTTDRNQPAPLDFSSELAVGESRTSRRTDGDLWDNVTEEVVLEDVGRIGSGCDTTVFEHRHEQTDNVAERPDEEAPASGDGKTYRRTVRETDEGTFDVTDSVTEEIPREAAQHSKQKTLRGVTETTVDRNVENSDVSVLEVGDRVSVEMTPGGRYNRTVTRVDRTAEDIDLGDQCQKTVFEHQQRKDTVVANKPSDIHVDDAGSGKTRQRTLRQTEEGAWEVSDVETVELEKTGAQHSKQKTLRGVTETTVDRNVDNADVEVTNVGDRISVEMTPGGRYNRTVTRVDRTAEDIDLGDQCQKTVFEHQQRKDTVVASKPADIHAADAGDGRTRQRTLRQTEEGAWEVSDVETEEIAREGAQHSKQKTLRGVTETTVDRNVENSDVEVMNVGDRVSVEMTPGGRYNRTVTRVDRTAEDIDLGDQCQRTVFEHQQRKDTVVASKPADVHAEPAGGGKTYQRTLRQTEEGAWEVSDVETEELAQPSARVERRKTLRGVTETTVSRNVDDSSTAVAAIGDVVIVEMTPGGRYNRTVSHVTSEPVGEIRRDCQKSGIVEHTDVTVQNVASDPGGDHVDTPERNKVVRRTVKITEEGSFDVEDETRTYVPTTAVAKSVWATETVTTTVVRHRIQDEAVVADMGDASAEPDETGAWTTRVTEVVPHPIDSGWLTWDSVVKSPTSTLKYKCGLRVFKNLAEPPVPDKGSDCNVSASVNKHGLYDGTITYRELTDWTKDGSGGGGGGIGTQTMYKLLAISADKKTGIFETTQIRVYQGGLSASQFAAEMNGENVTVRSAGGCVIFEKAVGRQVRGL